MHLALFPGVTLVLSTRVTPGNETRMHHTLSHPRVQLLGELLLDRHNFTTMTRYISNPENLKLMMDMLRDRSRNIQFEAFHVFKVRRNERNWSKMWSVDR